MPQVVIEIFDSEREGEVESGVDSVGKGDVEVAISVVEID